MEENKWDDIPNNIVHILRLPFKIAATSFAIGTFLLLLFLLGIEKNSIVGIGIAYVVVAFVVNSLALLIFIALSFIHREYQWQILGRACLLLLNLPVAFLYFVFVVSASF